MLDYAAALSYITSTGRFGIKLGLGRTRALLDAVGAPDRGLRGALVGGTNGKGSTCAFLCAILAEAGYRVAAMPKPHLSSYTERVVVDGRPIGEAEFATAVSALIPAIEAVTPEHGPPTEFEILTALALRHARDQGVDLLVCEVGMGGRLDATNVTDLGVKVITGVDLDHQRYLGDTVAEIAAEKAGIIRPGDIVVAGVLTPDALAIVEARVRSEGAQLWLAGRDFRAVAQSRGWAGMDLDFEVTGDSGLVAVAMPGLRTAMLGPHQADNAAVAVAAARAMARRHGIVVSDEAIREGVERTRWPGRLELFDGSPPVLVDGAHNPAAVAAVVAAVRGLVPAGVQLVFGAMSDKDNAAMLACLPREWPAVFTAVAEERALPAADLLDLARRLGRHGDTTSPGIEAALAQARTRAGAADVVLVLGSLYLAGEARDRLIAIPA